jgi:hypothetical protein
MYMWSNKTNSLKQDSEGGAEGFAREQHTCQPVGVLAERSLPAGRIFNRIRKFRIKTLA